MKVEEKKFFTKEACSIQEVKGPSQLRELFSAEKETVHQLRRNQEE